MAITIRGIRIVHIWIGKESDGKEKITSNYQLISSADKVLAEQSLSSSKGYGENQFVPAPATIKALTDAVALYRKDVEMSLGLDVTE